MVHQGKMLKSWDYEKLLDFHRIWDKLLEKTPEELIKRGNATFCLENAQESQPNTCSNFGLPFQQQVVFVSTIMRTVNETGELKLAIQPADFKWEITCQRLAIKDRTDKYC